MLAFEFPFPADVWGTVSEWIMITVTSITAFFLYQTLKSQKEVQQAQNRLLEIEQLRLREDYRPELKYSWYQTNNILLKPNQFPLSIAIRNVSNNSIRNLRVIYPTSKSIDGNAFQNGTQNLIKENEIAWLHLTFKSFEEAVSAVDIDFKILYEDLVGTKYKQLVFCKIRAKDNIEFISYEPEIQL